MMKIEGLTKRYPNGYTANKNISFLVQPGEVAAIIGANGSGKTTLFRQILGILKVQEGKILIDGRKQNERAIAYVPQFSPIYPALTVRETLKIALQYNRVKRSEISQRVDLMLEKTGLDMLSDRYAYTLSGGQLKLLSLAGALIQDKQYYVLDEVTSMVDVLTKERIWNLLKEEQARGKTILISSHDFAEVQRICDTVYVLKNGKIVFSGKTEELGENFTEKLVSFMKGEC